MFTAKMVSVLVLAVTLAGCNDRLRRAAADGDVKAVRNLIDGGADASQRTRGLIAAANHGHEEVVRMLVTARSAGEPVPGLALTRASANGHAAVVRVLLESGANVDHQGGNDLTALIIASARGHLEVVHALVEHGADHSLQSRQGQTPLLAASAEGHAEIVQTLLESGANLDHQDSNGRTALFFASARGRMDTVRLLLAHGANHSLQSRQGQTPLLAASEDGHMEVVEALLEHGANANDRDGDGVAALEYAANADIMDLLIRHGARGVHRVSGECGNAPSDVRSDLLAIWGTSAKDLFAVGQAGLIVHCDGESWSVMNSGSRNILQDVAGVSSDNVYAVGLFDTILHYDGNQWNSIESLTEASYYGIWVASANAVFVVGTGGTILSYDGRVWQQMDSGTSEYLLDVWGSTANDVYAVGTSGTIVHYDGDSWQQMVSPVQADLRGIHGLRRSEIYSVGSEGTIIRFDGARWIQVGQNPRHRWNGVHVFPDVVFVVGWDSRTGGIHLYNDDGAWEDVRTRSLIGRWSEINSIWGFSSTNYFTVGLDGIRTHFQAHSDFPEFESTDASENPKDLYDRAVSSGVEGEFTEARDLLRKAAGASPDNMGKMAIISCLRFAVDGAEARISTSLGKLLFASVASGNRGDWEASLTLAQKAVKDGPKYAPAYLHLGVVYAQLVISGRGDHYARDATAAYKEAIRIKPDYAQARFNLGVAYAATRQWEFARAELQHAKELAQAQDDSFLADQCNQMLLDIANRE